MTFKISKNLCLNAALLEDGMNISAGSLASDPVFDEEYISDNRVRSSLLELGCFVRLMRRDKGYTIVSLAEEADVEISELLDLENVVRHTPDPRTIYRLSEVFNVSQSNLMELSGLTRIKDNSFVEEAVRYAAKSESIEKLTDKEQGILTGFISVLSETKKEA